MPSLLIEYLTIVLKLWWKQIAGPVIASLGSCLVVVAPFFKTPSTSANLVRFGAVAMLAAAFYLMLVAGYEAWKNERNSGGFGQSNKPELAGEIISIDSRCSIDSRFDPVTWVYVLFEVRNLSAIETMLREVVLKLVDRAGNGQFVMLTRADPLMQISFKRGNVHGGSFKVPLDRTMQDISQSRSRIHITDAFGGKTLLSLEPGA